MNIQMLERYGMRMPAGRAATTLLKHGVTWSDIPTSIISPIKASAGINFVVGTAPSHLASDPAQANRPRLYNTYQQFVSEMGYSDDWKSYTLCEHAYSAFVLFGISPVVYCNVLDRARHKIQMPPAVLTIDANREMVLQAGAIASSVQVSSEDGETSFMTGVDYSTRIGRDGLVVISVHDDGGIGAGVNSLTVQYDRVSPEAITKADIIGGIDITNGNREGLETVEEVFPLYGVVPGILLAPGFSSDAEVAAVLEAKCESINGCFKARCAIDADTDEVKKAIDVPAWKNRNNIVFERQDCLWPKLGLTERVFNFSSQWGPLQMHTDATRGRDIPYFSASNKNLRINKTILADGSEIIVPKPDADYLNSQGIVTSINFIGGHRAWGNRTAAYPATSDVKDVFHSVRRTYDYIGNTIVLTVWQKVDEPMNRRLVDSVTESLQTWLNSLYNEGATLGAEVQFRHEENPTTELLAGHMVFHLFIAPPPPAEWIEFRLEFNVSYLNTLFPGLEESAFAA